MAVHSESTNQPFSPKKRRLTQASGFDVQRDVPISAGSGSRLSLGHSLHLLLEKFSVSVWVLFAIVGLSGWIGIGMVLGKLFPEYMVTVQQFEITPEISNRFSLSG